MLRLISKLGWVSGLISAAVLVFAVWWGLYGGIAQTVDAFKLEPNDNWMAVWGIARAVFPGLLLAIGCVQVIAFLLFGRMASRFFKRASTESLSSRGLLGQTSTFGEANSFFRDNYDGIAKEFLGKDNRSR